MPNFRIFGNSTSQIITSSEIASENGNVYIVSSGIHQLDKSSNSVFIMYLTNNSSDKTFSLGNICGSCAILSSFRLYNSTFSLTDPVNSYIHNGNSAFGVEGTIESKYKIQSTDPAATESSNLLGGFVQNSGVTIYPCNGSIQIGPGSSVSVIAKNIAASGTGVVGINISFIIS
ncbi:hypothetical protein IZY60_10875 [Lutibacter sp. B2]|nr:hypothetical protein [Lutibacter sp. B2]